MSRGQGCQGDSSFDNKGKEIINRQAGLPCPTIDVGSDKSDPTFQKHHL